MVLAERKLMTNDTQHCTCTTLRRTQSKATLCMYTFYRGHVVVTDLNVPLVFLAGN